MDEDALSRVEPEQCGRAAYRFEARDMIAASRCHFRVQFWRWQVLLSLALVVCGLALATWALDGSRGGLGQALQGVPGAVLLGGVLGGAIASWAVPRWHIPRRVRRFLAREPGKWDEVALAWDAEGLRVGAGRADSRMPWNHYARWLEDDEVVLLCFADRLYQFVPKRALGPGDLTSLRAFAAAGGVAGAS